MNSRLAGLAGATLIFAALTVLVTWPQALVPASQIANHHDAQFSIWRIGWIAHALASAPSTVFDANIFHPTPDALALSDTRIGPALVGGLAAGVLWAATGKLFTELVVYTTRLTVVYAGFAIIVAALVLEPVAAPSGAPGDEAGDERGPNTTGDEQPDYVMSEFG